MKSWVQSSAAFKKMGMAANNYKSCVWEVEGQGSGVQSSPGLCETLAPKQTNKEANKRNQKLESQNYSVPLVQNQTRKTFEGSSNVIQEAWLRPGPVLSKQWAADKTMFLPLWGEDHHHLKDWMGWRTYWWNWNPTSWEAPSEERERSPQFAQSTKVPRWVSVLVSLWMLSSPSLVLSFSGNHLERVMTYAVHLQICLCEYVLFSIYPGLRNTKH